MENASKALLIAGAILIAILLIGVAMLVFNGGRGGIDAAVMEMSANEKMMFNQKFTQYEGTNINGANVRALIGNIISSNSTYQKIDGKLVTLKIDNTGTSADNTYTPSATATDADAIKSNAMSTAKAQINTGATYRVTLEYNKATGLVNRVNVHKN